MGKNVIIEVAQSESNKIQTINEALKVAKQYEGKKVTIQIGKGIYKEKLEIKQRNLIFQGDTGDEVIITYDDYAKFIMPNGEKRGTFRTYSVLIDTDDFIARNIIFQNSAGPGMEVGQALALYIDGDRVTFEQCKMLGSQDTIFTAPMPSMNRIDGKFQEDKELVLIKKQSHYFKECYICGDVDFIFGGATAYFENCEIFSVNRNLEINGYITAPSTPKGQNYGYVFKNCRFTSNCEPNSVYLGRPWRDYGRVVIIDSWIGEHIKEEGWHNWNREYAQDTVFFAEYGNRGPGSDVNKRVSWAKQLTKEEALMYSKENVLYK